jgi:hypothetical protein
MLDLALFAPTEKLAPTEKVGALLLPRRELTPTQVLKNWPQIPQFFNEEFPNGEQSSDLKKYFGKQNSIHRFSGKTAI